MEPGLFVVGNRLLAKTHPADQSHDADITLFELAKGIENTAVHKEEVCASSWHIP